MSMLPAPRATILAVDDLPANLDVLRVILGPSYRLKVALDGARALEIAASADRPDLILLDVMMPGMDGFELCQRLKADPRTRAIPVLFLTARGQDADETRGFAVGAVDYLTKPLNPQVVLARVRTHLALADQNRLLEQMVEERTRELVETRLEIIRHLGSAAEFRDQETGLHIVRMSNYCKLIAQALGLPAAQAELFLAAAPMHDVGKIGIPDRVLFKPAKLDDDEWQIMRQHPALGARIIGQHDSELLHLAAEVALSHHERWDGRGYPLGLKGEGIPLIGRVAAVADVFDALTSDRPYKRAWSWLEARTELENNRGIMFEPRVVDAFLGRMPEALEVMDRFRDLPVAPVLAGH
jgi:putative two-component system response regulator